MTERVFSFSPGPAVLPLKVLEEAQRNLVALPELGVSPLEIGHRTPWFEGVLDETEANLRRLLAIPDNYRIIFMQGGSRLQFSLVAMNLLRGTGGSADYVVTGSWGQMAMQEGAREGTVRAAYNSKPHNFDRLPQSGELDIDPKARYVHITSNETIQGVQHQTDPDFGGVPLVADMSSDFLYRPLDIARYGLIYACAQKNAGPAGVTIVILRDDVLASIGDGLPTMLDYRSFVKEKSLLNTPPVFAVYIVLLVTRWLLNDVGGLAAMLERNRRKAAMLYDVIDQSRGFYRGHAQPNSRSLMNVTFRLADESTQDRFVKQAQERGLVDLKGHRSVGGIRASIYNAMPVEGVERLRDFMREFAKLA